MPIGVNIPQESIHINTHIGCQVQYQHSPFNKRAADTGRAVSPLNVAGHATDSVDLVGDCLPQIIQSSCAKNIQYRVGVNRALQHWQVKEVFIVMTEINMIRPLGAHVS